MALVVAYHVAPDAVPGGFLGVDVFFVLSGYLIASLVVVEVGRSGRLDLAGFYVRRAKRLLPALLLVVTAIAAYSHWWASPDELPRLRSHSLWSLGYLANWRYITDGTTYTDILYGESPLRHTWSLAIEEQFYVAFPLLVLALGAAARWRWASLRASLASVAAAGALVSAGWMALLWGDGSDPSRGYFGTDTRAQALLIGVVAGCLAQGRAVPAEHVRARLAGAAAWAGAAVLAVAVMSTSETSSVLQHGGFMAVALAAAGLIAGAERAPVLGAVLRCRPLTALGLISYGVYLWHWPVLVLLDEGRTGVSGWRHTAVALAVTLGASVVSYVLVERPIRHARVAAGQRVRVLGVATAALVVVGGVIAAATVKPGLPALEAIEPAPSVGPDERGADDAPRPPGPLRVLMFGDSVAHSIAGGVVDGTFEEWKPEQTAFDPERVNLASVARISCSYLSNMRVLKGERQADTSILCGGWQEEVDRVLAEDDFDYVLVALHLDVADHVDVDGEVAHLGTERHQALFDRFADELRAIAARHDAEIVLVAPPPGEGRVVESLDVDVERTRLFRDELQDYAARRPGVVVLDLFEQVCPGDDCSDPDTGFDPRYRYDGYHYGPEGARWVAAWLTEQLETVVWPAEQPTS